MYSKGCPLLQSGIPTLSGELPSIYLEQCYKHYFNYLYHQKALLIFIVNCKSQFYIRRLSIIISNFRNGLLFVRLSVFRIGSIISEIHFIHIYQAEGSGSSGMGHRIYFKMCLSPASDSKDSGCHILFTKSCF